MIYDMEATNKNDEKGFKHITEDCQCSAKRHISETRGDLDDATAVGEDMAAQLAIELLMEEQRLSRKHSE
jgi:hypothetical protein